MKPTINIAIVDDHEIIRNGLSNIIDGKNNIKVIIKASNGKEFLELLESTQEEVNIALIDISMSIMDGYETTRNLIECFPNIKPICLSVYNDFEAVFKMINAGAKAYLAKDCTEQALIYTIKKVSDEGNYFDSFVIEKMKQYGHSAEKKKYLRDNQDLLPKLSEKEIEFLKLCCSEKPYKEIASDLNISVRTVDGYREILFTKLEIKSRVGLVLFAIENGIYIPKYRETNI